MIDADSPWQRILLATEHTAFDVGAERVGLALAARGRLPLVAMVPLVTNAALVAEAPEVAARVDEEAATRGAGLLRMVATAGVSIDGMSDHTVSQSLYLRDPDGNEVELYVDADEALWKNNPSAVLAPIKPLSL